jgi:hypothetical protein
MVRTQVVIYGRVEIVTTSFAIYRHQAEILVVLADGHGDIAAKKFSMCQ